ncbi:MAG TPA: glycoside hydrolase family 32 protein [Roseiflexaceae bacterium]|nr:glycoside hydrolase family 32 protein [Roseiflexaceae bacterium]
MTDILRPLYHFTPPSGWLNDPNGMVYDAGEYHLFYQHHPTSLVWDSMHWGHAVSRDLVRWEHLPIALAPDALGTIFSGSAVVDERDTAEFGVGALVAAFTYAADRTQTQALAFSADHGRSWIKYAGNPVLLPEDGRVDFRDPKVFWYGQGGVGHWMMALSAGDSIWLYRSPDLKHWVRTSIFGHGYGAHGGVWETPDLFELPIDGEPATKWVLVVAVMTGAPAGGSGVQYFVGEFDGATFTCDDPPEHVRWADLGADFYAPQSWSNVPGGRRIWLAWMNNWSYARQVPASTWRGSMTLPRDLALTRTSEGVRLTQRPTPELARLRGARHSWSHQTIAAGRHMLEGVVGDALEIVAVFNVDPTAAERFGVQVRVGEQERTTIGYDARRGELYLDRSQAGQMVPGFDLPQAAPLALKDRPLELRIFVDRASVEVFAEDGRVVLTNQIFPSAASSGVALFSEGGPAQLIALDVYELAPAS